MINLNGQVSKSEHEKVYRLNYKFEIPVTVGIMAINYYGFSLIKQKPALEVSQINALNKNDVWAFDRRALEQYYSYSSRQKALTISDWGMNIALALPILLIIDKKIRKDWYDILLIYVETIAINTQLSYAVPLITNRIRPFVYYPEIPIEEKMEWGSTTSFFSGHTSTTAAASFFMAKVISDYHPELGAKKWLLYAAAMIPPTFVGYHRYRGLKHFPTDIAIGTIVGATVGILIPHFHKINKRNNNISLVPYTGEYSGLAFKMKF
jgi:membrane-associated phospholipid phosphatase